MKQTQPGKGKGHPQAFCILTTVSDISLAKQSGVDVCFQRFSWFSDSRSFPVGPDGFFLLLKTCCVPVTSPNAAIKQAERKFSVTQTSGGISVFL